MEASAARNLIVREFTQRRTRNPAYSLRAFARDLGIGVTSLSDFLADKRKLSRATVARIAEALRLSPQERDQVIREARRQAPERSLEETQRLQIEDATFRLIADWHYLAILSLALLKQNQARPAWVARRLGLTVEVAREALERLTRMKLLEKRDGRLVRTAQPLSTASATASEAIRKHHLDKLRLAERSLLCDPVETREFVSITMPTDPAKLARARLILHQTARRIGKLLEDGESSEVYVLNMQLFPLTRPGAGGGNTES